MAKGIGRPKDWPTDPGETESVSPPLFFFKSAQ
jgi:hypothetical protein